MLGLFKWENEFEVVQPKPKTKIVKEYLYKLVDSGYWEVYNRLIPESEAKSYFSRINFSSDVIYKPTGREFEVDDYYCGRW